MANEVVIKVVSKNDTTKGFAEARKGVEKFANDSSDVYQQKFAERMKDLGRNLTTPLANSGKDMGVRLGNSSAGEITRTISERITEELPKAVSRGFVNNGGTALYRSAGTEIGKSVGQGTNDGFDKTVTDHITEKLKTTVRSSVRHVGEDASIESALAGDRIGDDISKTLHKKITEKIKTSVDVDTSGGISGRAEKLGEKIGDDIGNGMGGSLSSFFSGDLISLLVKVLAGGALATALAPVLGAAITTAVLGGLGAGVLGAGIAGALRDPQIKGAAADLKKVIGDAFTVFGQPFRSPVADTFEKLDKFIKSIAPKMKELGEYMAPVVGELGTGLVSLLQNAMPGILEAVKASKPLFETLAKHLPAIGTALGKFFDKISEQGDDANVFFDDLLSAIEGLVVVLGNVIAALTSAYSVMHNVTTNGIKLFKSLWSKIKEGVDYVKGVFYGFLSVVLEIFEKMLTGAAIALSWIPGLGGKLNTAVDKFHDFRKDVNKELNKIADRHVKVTVSTYGLAAAQAALSVGAILKSRGYAHGGIIGAAAGGGPRGGMTLVGEGGPELVSLPTGSTVHSNGDSRRMLADSGQGSTVTVEFAPSAGDRLVDALIEQLRYRINRLGGGNVQSYLGAGAS